jgi:hypothetical protein
MSTLELTCSNLVSWLVPVNWQQLAASPAVSVCVLAPVLMSLFHACSLICRPQQLHNCGSIMIGLHTCGCAGGNWPACMRITATLAATGVVPYSRTHRSKLPYFWYLLLQHGHTPLLLAAQQGHPEVVGMLLDSGAAGDARNTVRSPLELAEGSRLGPQLHAIGASTSGWAGCADVKNKASCVCTRVLSSEKLGSGHLMHGSELWMGCMQ